MTDDAAVEGSAAIADGLSRLLADTYPVYFKTHNCHWNAAGPMFHTLHLLFETQYNELAVDLIAARIRALGAPAPASYREFAQVTTFAEDVDRPDATGMIRPLVAGHDALISTAKSVFRLTEPAHDEPTADLLAQHIQAHEKAAWMLRSRLA